MQYNSFANADNNLVPLVHSLQIGIFQCEPTADGIITFANQSLAAILGYDSPGDILNTHMPLSNFFANRDEYDCWLKRTEDLGVVNDFDVKCRRGDGKVHTISIISNVVQDAEGNNIRIDGAIRDIHATMQERLENEIVANVNSILLSNLDMRKVYHLICGELRKVIEWDRVAITLLESKGCAVINYALTKGAYKESGILSRRMSEEKHYSVRGSILEEILETGRPVIVKDTISSTMETDKIYGSSGIRSRLGFPLRFKGNIIGSINFGCADVDYYDKPHIALLEKIAPSLALGIENTEKLDERLENEVMANINKTLVSNLNMKEVDHIICDELYKIIEWDRVSITLLESKGDVVINFVLTRKKGALSRIMPEKSRYPLIGSILEKVVNTGKPFIVTDTLAGLTETDQIYANEGIRSRLAYPLEYKDKIIGSINFGRSKENYYDNEHIKLLGKIAPSIAFGLENSKLFERATKAEKEFKDLSQTFDSPWG